MKISKSLLQAIALGVTLGAVSTSCSKDQYAVEPSPTVISEPSPIDNVKNQNNIINMVCPQTNTYHDCPGCGMG